MARRSLIFEELLELPWQIGAVMAALCYPIALLLSGYLASKPILESASSVPLRLWPLFAVLFGFASLLSLIIRKKKRNLYKQSQSIQKIRNLTWQQFEFHVGEAYREKGYVVAETPKGADGGVDLILRKDGEKTFVQCKHWKLYKVGVGKVRELLGSMVAGDADHGVLVATGTFTVSAIQFARQNGIKLVQGEDIECMVQVSSEGDTLLPESVKKQPECPVCNSFMIKRTAKKGKKVGQQFWGCSGFPTCKGTRNLIQ